MPIQAKIGENPVHGRFWDFCTVVIIHTFSISPDIFVKLIHSEMLKNHNIDIVTMNPSSAMSNFKALFLEIDIPGPDVFKIT